MVLTVNFGCLSVSFTMYALRHGMTVYHVNKFDEADFMHHLLSFKVGLQIYLFDIVNGSMTYNLAQIFDVVPIHSHLVCTQFSA